MTKEAERTFAYQRVAAEIAQELRRGVWTEDEPMPSEHQLAASHGVGRKTIRRALAIVESDGLISKARGRRSLPRSRQVDASSAGEGFAVAARRAGHVETTRVLWTRRRASGIAESRALEIQRGTEIVEICRLRLLDGSPALRQISVLPATLAERLPLSLLSRQSLYAMIATALQTRVATRGERIALSALTRDEARDLGLPQGQPALRVERVACDEAGQPVEYSVAAIVSPEIRFSLGRP